MAAISSSFRPVEHKVHWENIATADGTRTLALIFPQIMKYLETRPEVSFRDVERQLRSERRWTHLIAKEADPNHPCYPPVFRGATKVYELWMSTRDQAEAEEERLRYAGSEEANLSRLANDTGPYGGDTKRMLSIPAALGGRLEFSSEAFRELLREGY
ncbi:MAG: hypothetical protein JSR76_04255 [Verrucomicrobia bacterium]|nr:hypothetical protein [Verrucomicrobiota bacterium]